MNDNMLTASPKPSLPPIPGSFLSQPLVFERSDDSPFEDKYSIEREELALRDLLESEEPDPLDPRYPRLELLEQRKQQRDQMQTAWRLRSGAEKTVPDAEAMRMRDLGALEDESVDTMALHTKEAFRLFMGRARDTESKFSPIIGGKRVASALKSLWYLSGNNNPYADWALLLNTQATEMLRQHLAAQTKGYEKEMGQLSKRGLTISLLRSAEPKKVELGFKSPYGYAIAELIVDYDYFVRMVKTLVRKDRLSDAQGQSVIRELTRKIRGSFEELCRFERFLMRPELRALSRADFLPDSQAESAKRAEAVRQIFGPVPADIFTGKLTPRHSKRRINISEQELNLLQRIAEGQGDERDEGKGQLQEDGLV